MNFFTLSRFYCLEKIPAQYRSANIFVRGFSKNEIIMWHFFLSSLYIIVLAGSQSFSLTTYALIVKICLIVYVIYKKKNSFCFFSFTTENSMAEVFSYFLDFELKSYVFILYLGKPRSLQRSRSWRKWRTWWWSRWSSRWTTTR